jgi:L-lactate dehydrogenase complex protein LldG
MKESTSREKILKKIRNALLTESENPYPNVDNEKPIYHEITESLDLTFAEEFIKVAGKFVYCENENEFLSSLKMLIKENKWKPPFCIDKKIKSLLDAEDVLYTDKPEDFHKLKVGITRCEYLIARLGSAMVSSKHDSGRRLNFYPEIHIILAYTSQLVPDLKDAFTGIKEKYGSKLPSMINVITGPSRTADIEKTLVMGAHGPKDLYVFLVDDSNLSNGIM